MNGPEQESGPERGTGAQDAGVERQGGAEPIDEMRGIDRAGDGEGAAGEPGALAVEPDRERRQAADRLLADHGAVVYRYCAAMVNDVGLASIMPTVFGHVEEHLAELDAPDGGSARRTLHALAHNRCVQYGRTGGAAPGGEGLDPERARVIDALAQLRPVGRGVVLLRVVFGLRWSEMGRVCGLPRLRMIRRSCRAWRRMAVLIGSKDEGAGRNIGDRPQGQPLSEDPAAWAAIRADARRFVAIRDAIRRTYVDRPPPEGWRAEVWQRLDERRAETRREAERREAERREAERREAEQREAEQEARREAAEAPKAGPFWHEDDDQDGPQEATSPHRSMRWRWLAVGVVLAVVSLAARWLLMR